MEEAEVEGQALEGVVAGAGIEELLRGVAFRLFEILVLT